MVLIKLFLRVLRRLHVWWIEDVFRSRRKNDGRPCFNDLYTVLEPRHKKRVYDICEQQMLRTYCACAQSDQRICCLHTPCMNTEEMKVLARCHRFRDCFEFLVLAGT